MSKISDAIKRAGLSLGEEMFVVANNQYFSQFGDYEWAETSSLDEVKRSKIKPYLWKLISPDDDEITRKVVEDKDGIGYFIKAKENTTAVAPINTCYVINQPSFEQNVHNVIVAEPGAKLQILTGCTADHQMAANIHRGITEIYVKEGAEVVFTMIHSWSSKSRVFPKTAVKVEKGGQFISNYLIFDPVMEMKANPKVYLDGEAAKAVLKSFIYSHPDSKIDLGGEVHLNSNYSRGEIETHAVVGGGETVTRGTLYGRAEEIVAHLECSAIVLSDKAKFKTIPALVSELDNLNMSHEASIGKISRQQIEYLQTRGIDEEDARRMIVRGFIDQSVGDLTPFVQSKINQILAKTSRGL